jgi:putative oxidoreductase
MRKLRDLVLRVARAIDWLPPLAVRIVIGILFVTTGWGKLHNLEKVTGFFAELHIPAPHFNAVLVACTELFGGALLIIGLVTRIACIPLFISMLVALLTAKLGKIEDWTDVFGFEELHYMLFFLWLAVAGPGPISLDWLLGRKWFKQV